MTSPTQPEPAEGTPADGGSQAPGADRPLEPAGGGEGASAEAPAEGGDEPPGRSGGSPPADPGTRPVTLAAVAGAHGIGGEVKLKLFTDDLGRYGSFNGGALTLASLRGPIARFAEIGDRGAAERLRGTALTVSRAALPPLEPGEYYHVDLIGLACVSTVGETLGRVVDIADFGAGDVIEIERPDGRCFMVPMGPAVPEWDAERLVVDAAFVS